MFNELRQRRLNTEEQRRASAKQAENQRLQLAAEQAAKVANETEQARRESRSIIEMARQFLPQLERLMGLYCEAITGSTSGFSPFVYGDFIDLSDNSRSSSISSVLSDGHRQRKQSSFSVEDYQQLLSALRGGRHREIDSLLLQNRSRFALSPLHGQRYEYVVTAAGFKLHRVTDTEFNYEGGDNRHPRFMSIHVNASGLGVHFDSDELYVTAQVATIIEMEAKMTEIELQIQEKYPSARI